MASAAEALGMTLPGSSSFPAETQEKHEECASVGPYLHNLIAKNILPRDIMTRSAFENAMVLTMILGGSTNAVLHLIAMAHSVGITLTIDDFQRVSDRIPFVADIKPSGKYVMEDVYKIGGIPKVLAYLLENKLIDGDNMTVTGLTLGENLDRWTHKHGQLDFRQDVIRPLDKPLKPTGHIRILKGNLAPGGAVAKITGKEGLDFIGKARTFDSEDEFVRAVEAGSIKKRRENSRHLALSWSQRRPWYARNVEAHESDHGCWLGPRRCLSYRWTLQRRISWLLYWTRGTRSPSRRSDCPSSGWRHHFC